MYKSGYILAGAETLGTLLNNFHNKRVRNSFDNNFNTKDISNLLSKVMSGFLHSFGQNFTGKKTYKNYVEQEAKVFQTCRDFGYFDDSLFYVDSGGFQASIGKIDEHETDNLIKLYGEFVSERNDVFDRAFVLDLPPGPGCKLFKNFGEVYEKNLETYSFAKNLPDNVREKMVYIHHFRSPKLWDIFTRILDEDNMFLSFNHFSTGGIVANMSGDTKIPYVIYSIPLVPLLNRTKKYGRKKLDFHILGGSSFRDVFFYELFQLHVKKVHDIDLKFTYDSSGLFKGLMIGRFMNVMDNGIVKKIDLRTNSLDKRFASVLSNRKVIDVYHEILSNLASKWNLKQIDLQGVYNKDTGTFFDDVKIYSMLYMLDFYSVIQEFLHNAVEEIYSYYEDGNIEEFINRINLVTKILNGGKITKKQKAKTISVQRTLNLLTNLNEEHCKMVVDKYLAKDEFSSLGGINDSYQI